MNLRELVEGTSTRRGRTFDLVIQALILLSIVTFTIETMPGLSERTQRVLHWMEVGCVAIFTAEYLLRLYVAKPRTKYALSFFGLVDLLAILPFYLQLGMDLRAIRVLRAIRLVRILKLVRYSRALQRFRRAFVEAKEELLLYFGATAILMYLSSVGIYYCENDAQPEAFASVPDALWWAVATFTTVGYGDVFPVTPAGKILTFVVLMLGLGVVAVPSAILASALTKVRREERGREEKER